MNGKLQTECISFFLSFLDTFYKALTFLYREEVEVAVEGTKKKYEKV